MLVYSQDKTTLFLESYFVLPCKATPALVIIINSVSEVPSTSKKRSFIFEIRLRMVTGYDSQGEGMKMNEFWMDDLKK
jgi:hypothetical protein